MRADRWAGGRQRIRELAITAIALALGSGVTLIGMTQLRPGFWIVCGSSIIGVSSLMLGIGFAYLLVNMVWIRKALRHPAPTLRSLVAGADGDSDSDSEPSISCSSP